jgi:hypothetical protein
MMLDQVSADKLSAAESLSKRSQSSSVPTDSSAVILSGSSLFSFSSALIVVTPRSDCVDSDRGADTLKAGKAKAV